MGVALGCVLGAGLLLALCAGWVRAAAGGAPSPGRPLAPIVDLARDPAWRLSLLPGIGARRAGDIVHARRRAGPLTSLADLRLMPGIGPVTVRRVADAKGLRVRLDGRPVGCRDGPPREP